MSEYCPQAAAQLVNNLGKAAKTPSFVERSGLPLVNDLF